MKLITFCFSLFIAGSAFADTHSGYPVNIQSTKQGLFFSLSCAPSKTSGPTRLKRQLEESIFKISTQIDKVRCDILKLRDPKHTCSSPTNSAPADCYTGKTRYLIEEGFESLTTSVLSAYSSQTEISVQGTPLQSVDMVYVKEVTFK